MIRGGPYHQGMLLNPVSVTDDKLMSQICSATDRETADRFFGEVFNRYHNRVVAWCTRMTHNRDEACDLAQEVFLKAYRHRLSFRGDSSLSTWLYAIARNHCLTAVKKSNGGPIQLDLVVHTRVRDTTTVDPGTAAERTQRSRRLLQLMTRTLNPLEARVMTLHYGHDVPLAVITRDLALENPSGAKAYIVNARRKLKSKLRGQDFLRVAA